MNEDRKGQQEEEEGEEEYEYEHEHEHEYKHEKEGGKSRWTTNLDEQAGRYRPTKS